MLLTRLNSLLCFIFLPESNIAQAGELGVIDSIVKAIKTNINNVEICENGCEALSNLAMNSKVS